MSSFRQLVLVTSGPVQLLERLTALTSHINSLVTQGGSCTRVLLTIQPSIRSQLTGDNVALWSKATTKLYCGVSNNLDLAIRLGGLSSDDSNPETLDLESLSVTESETTTTSGSTDRVYSHVALGGTFDRLHTGHKILLTEAMLRCSARVTVGVTGSQLLQKKTLTELIASVDDRISGVKQFAACVDEGIEHNIVEIQDPFGPAVILPELECIVASEETEKGCRAINERRRDTGLGQLDVHLIALVQDQGRLQDCEEDKVSSSSARIRLLGTRLREPLQPHVPGVGPYLIGLTGGSASGKTSVGQRLAGLGFGVINCDKLGHEAYIPGTNAYHQIVKEFGEGVLADDGTIVRRALGAIVFKDKTRLELLNQIVWPEISRLALERASQMWKEGIKVVVLDAAVLLEAGWDNTCNEVWTCVVPKSEAINRIVERDKVTEGAAEQRLNSQLSNQERVDKSCTVFCTLWDPSITQSHVERAVGRLKIELGL